MQWNITDSIDICISVKSGFYGLQFCAIIVVYHVKIGQLPRRIERDFSCTVTLVLSDMENMENNVFYCAHVPFANIVVGFDLIFSFRCLRDDMV